VHQFVPLLPVADIQGTASFMGGTCLYENPGKFVQMKDFIAYEAQFDQKARHIRFGGNPCPG
jgi:hypothetical protein